MGRSEALAASWRDPAVRKARTEGISRANTKRMRDPEVRARHLAGIAAAMAKPGRRAQIAELNRLGRSGPKNNFWRGDQVGYAGVHQRLGSASAGACVDCDRPAREWSLQPDTPPGRLLYGQLEGRARLTPYSLEPSDYVRRCRSCHAAVDLSPRRNPLCPKGHEYATHRNGTRQCNACRRHRQAEAEMPEEY